MKALFGRNRKNEYPDHHYPEQGHPYYPPKTAARFNDSHAGLADVDSYPAHNALPFRQPSPGRLTTLEALQIIRRRFEESQKASFEDPYEDQAA